MQTQTTKKRKKSTFSRILLWMSVLLLIAGGIVAWLMFGSNMSNPHNYKTIGEIEVPLGYERLKVEPSSFGAYLRNVPLKPRGSQVMLYTGGRARMQRLNYAVVDLPLISNWEQCADCCMRLRAEYLFNTKQYGRIHFQDVNGKTMHYEGGGSRKALETYLKKAYGVASTFSLSRELPRRQLKDMLPGDVLVYAARPGHKYGHAVIVVDVAVNKKTGKKAFLLAEGATPARSIHVMKNLKNPFRSPWFMLDEDAETIWTSVFWFNADQLRHFKD